MPAGGGERWAGRRGRAPRTCHWDADSRHPSPSADPSGAGNSHQDETVVQGEEWAPVGPELHAGPHTHSRPPPAPRRMRVCVGIGILHPWESGRITERPSGSSAVPRGGCQETRPQESGPVVRSAWGLFSTPAGSSLRHLSCCGLPAGAGAPRCPDRLRRPREEHGWCVGSSVLQLSCCSCP